MIYFSYEKGFRNTHYFRKAGQSFFSITNYYLHYSLDMHRGLCVQELDRTGFQCIKAEGLYLQRSFESQLTIDNSNTRSKQNVNYICKSAENWDVMFKTNS